MPAYNLCDENFVGSIDVQFSPLSIPMTAWYAWINGGDQGTRQAPVLGVLLRHEVNADGAVVGSSAKMAVHWEENDELLPADDRLLLNTNEVLVGIYPAGFDAPADHISSALEHIRGRLAEQKA